VFVSSITIRNLRSIDELVLSLQNGLTTIVGANSSGKSNILRGFELFFTGKIDRRPFSAALDMPTWIINAKAPAARSSIKVEFDLSARSSARLWSSVEGMFGKKGWPPPLGKRLTVIRYFSRGGASGFQCAISGKGTRESECDELQELAMLLIRRVEYRYVPSLKDLQSDSFRQVSEELKGRLLSVWSGGDRREVAQKRDAFQKIREEIEKLIQDSARGLSDSLHSQFPEVASLKLAMASIELEDMIGSLEIFADDGHETLMRQKGSGIQGASIIHMLRILRDTAPRGANNKQLFLWNIEEPETFLHPSAQRRLASLLRGQAINTQILATTHSPLFVDRRSPASNVLVRRSEDAGHYITALVKLPREDPLKPIRLSLGTSLADSLSLHEAVVLVEGLSDVTVFSEAYRRLCKRRVLDLDPEYVAFVAGHGASQQATSFNILRSWSPLSKLVGVFDFDRAGREDGARRLKSGVEGEDFFYLPHNTADVVLEDLYSPNIRASAEADEGVAQRIVTTCRPDGRELSRTVEWNKDQLAHYFLGHATDPEWSVIEQFVENVVRTLILESRQ
jgi:predicted ATP-dependent endonuclease of OLD family